MKWLGPAMLVALTFPAAARAAPAARCVAAPAEVSLPGLRPQPVAICDYEPAEFHARVTRLMAVPRGGHGIETLERLFALPRVTTLHDDPNSASYSIIARSAPGRTPWSALIAIDERFADRRAHFRGTLRPVRLVPGERGETDVDIRFLGVPAGFRAGAPFCLPAARLARAAARFGWRPSLIVHVVFDAPPPPSLDLVRGGLSFHATLYDRESACIASFNLIQPAIRPDRRPVRNR